MAGIPVGSIKKQTALLVVASGLLLATCGLSPDTTTIGTSTGCREALAGDDFAESESLCSDGSLTDNRGEDQSEGETETGAFAAADIDSNASEAQANTASSGNSNDEAPVALSSTANSDGAASTDRVPDSTNDSAATGSADSGATSPTGTTPTTGTSTTPGNAGSEAAPATGASTTPGNTGSDPAPPASSSVVVYGNPGSAAGILESTIYDVTVSHNGVDQASYVNMSVNNHTNSVGVGQPEVPLTSTQREQKFRTDNNHWTSFEFDEPITVSVDVPPGTLSGNISVRPASSNISVALSDNTASFQISQPGQYYLVVGSLSRDPLFIFANDVADPAPNVSDSNVFTGDQIRANPSLLSGAVDQTIYFGPGVHTIAEPVLNGNGTINTSATEQAAFPTLPSNTTVYIDGGAYVKGLLHVGANVQNVHIVGDGVLSGFDYPHQSTGWDNHMIHFEGYNGSSNISVEGITIVDMPKTCITARSGPVSVVNVKCMGWHANTDGIAGGAGSEVRDSFFKVFDDVIKIFHSNITVDSNVIWHQQTGSAFQLSWNTGGAVTNGRVSNIDFIAVERFQGTVLQTGGSASDYPAGSRANGQINNALVNSRNLGGGTISNIEFSNIRFDVQPFQLVQLQLKDHRTGFTSGTGNISDITIRNVTMPQGPRIDSYILDNGIGTISNITLSNLTVGGGTIDPSSIRIDETTNPN